MSFTTQEKAEVLKFVLCADRLQSAGLKLADALRFDGGANRPVIATVLEGLVGTWKAVGNWFENISASVTANNVGKPRPPRSEELALARADWDLAVAALNKAITNCGTLELLGLTKSRLVEALGHLSSFDWTLPYTDPIHDKIPGSPFDETKTIVGPHGDLELSKMTIESYHRYQIITWQHQNKLYRIPTNFPINTDNNSASDAMYFLTSNMANQIGRMARAWGMHVEVLLPSDEKIINDDAEASSHLRPASFFRALLQVELFFNTDKNAGFGKNFRGRNWQTGVTRFFRLSYFGTLVGELAKVNSHEEFLSWFVNPSNGQPGGPAWDFYADFADMWTHADAWGLTGIGFFHALPAPPDTPQLPPVDPGEPAVIPEGFFDAEVAQLGAVAAEVEVIKTALRNKEGQPV